MVLCQVNEATLRTASTATCIVFRSCSSNDVSTCFLCLTSNSLLCVTSGSWLVMAFCTSSPQKYHSWALFQNSTFCCCCSISQAEHFEDHPGYGIAQWQMHSIGQKGCMLNCFLNYPTTQVVTHCLQRTYPCFWRVGALCKDYHGWRQSTHNYSVHSILM